MRSVGEERRPRREELRSSNGLRSTRPGKGALGGRGPSHNRVGVVMERGPLSENGWHDPVMVKTRGWNFGRVEDSRSRHGRFDSCHSILCGSILSSRAVVPFITRQRRNAVGGCGRHSLTTIATGRTTLVGTSPQWSDSAGLGISRFREDDGELDTEFQKRHHINRDSARC